MLEERRDIVSGVFWYCGAGLGKVMIENEEGAEGVKKDGALDCKSLGIEFVGITTMVSVDSSGAVIVAGGADNDAEDVMGNKIELEDVVNNKTEVEDVVDDELEVDVVNDKLELKDVVNDKLELEDVVDDKLELVSVDVVNSGVVLVDTVVGATDGGGGGGGGEVALLTGGFKDSPVVLPLSLPLPLLPSISSGSS